MKILRQIKDIFFDRSIKLVVGSGQKLDKGWYHTDIDTLNLLKTEDWKNLTSKYSIKAIMAEHVWEHLTEQDGITAAQNCYIYLEEGGYFRIAVPDGYNPSEEYINYVKPGGTGKGSDDHKVLYTYKTLSKILEIAGFKVKLLEYFDENGQFHFNDWNKDDGLILRSKRFDPRNAGDKLGYTSLIIDAIKVKSN